ncbi:MAG: F390 synthetase-related protein [Candidatus Thorarchaeota archaeon]
MNILQKLLYVRRLHHQFYRWNRKKLEVHQNKRIKKIIEFARKNSNYYNQILNDKKEICLLDIPVLNKEKMMTNFNQINTAGLDKDRLIEYYLLQEQNSNYTKFQREFSIGLSSGTSGNKSLTILSQKESDLYNCLLFSRNGIPQKIKNKRILFALRRYNPTFMEVQSFGVKLCYIDYTLSSNQMLELINKKRLNILAGPPSLLEILARYKEDIHHEIEAIISYAEVLADSLKKKLEDTFQVPIIQIYQGAEGFIASTCKHGNLHLNEDVLYFEFIDLEDKIGQAKNIIITDLYRTTQPILRYQMNDILEISPDQCTCGSCFRVISKIHGRSDDVFHLLDKEGKIKFLFPDYIRRSINQASEKIIEYQAIQISPSNIEIRLVLSDEINKVEIQQKILANLVKWADKLEAIIGQVEFSEKLPEINPISKKLIRVQRRF